MQSHVTALLNVTSNVIIVLQSAQLQKVIDLNVSTENSDQANCFHRSIPGITFKHIEPKFN